MSKLAPSASKYKKAKNTMQGQTSRVESLEQELHELRGLLEEQGKTTVIGQVLLNNHDGILDKCTIFNEEVRRIADTLAMDIIYRQPDAFQEELNHCHEKCRAVIGQRLTEQLCLQAQNAASETSKPVAALMQVALAIFFVSFCVSEVRGSALDSNYTADNKRQEAEAQPTSTALSFKSALLINLSNLLKTAAWGINTSDRRAAFENSLDPLYDAWRALRTAVEKPLNSCKLKLSFPFINGMEEVPSEAKNVNTPSKYATLRQSPSHKIESTSHDIRPFRRLWPKDIAETATLEAIVGATGVGVVVEVFHKATPFLKTSVHAQLVSEADLQCLLMGVIPSMCRVIIDVTSAPGGRSRDRAEEELQNYKDQLKRSREDHDRTLLELKLYKDLVQSFQNEMCDMQGKIEDAATRFQTNVKKRLSANFFWTNPDSLAISDLMQQLTSVNDVIFRVASSLGEFLVRRKRDLSHDDARKAYESSCDIVGTPATALLYAEAQNPDAKINPLLARVVLQVILTTFCARKIQTWAYNEPIFNKQIRALYQEIRGFSKDQSVSGRWRALTLAHLNPDTQLWKDELIQTFVDIMRVASWDIGTLEQKNNFEQQLLPIFKATVDLRVSLGEKITSADIEIVCVGPGVPFDKIYMEESYGDNRNEHNTHEKILATVGLGLHKVMPPSSTPSSELVVPPKVVLESSLKAALVPALPRSSRSRRRENKHQKPHMARDENGYQDGRD